MKYILTILTLWGILFSGHSCLAISAPHQLGGFTLGADISEYKSQLNMESSLPVRYAENIREVAIKETTEFKSGLIAYGTCAVPNKIVRIKLKYADDSKDFFDMLLTRYETKFGKAAEWRGDPFHIVITWKWSFVDSKGNHISLILQHNKLDTDEKIGNSVKLTLIDAIDKDRQCYDKAHPASSGSLQSPQRSNSQPNWDKLLPR